MFVFYSYKKKIFRNKKLDQFQAKISKINVIYTYAYQIIRINQEAFKIVLTVTYHKCQLILKT